jgi:hypothetical protein
MNALRDAVSGGIAFGALVAFALAMVTHLRVWSVARDVRRIADALEVLSLKNHEHAVEMNDIRE